MFGDCTRCAKFKKEVHEVIHLIKGIVYTITATHNELRDNEANLPGVPPNGDKRPAYSLQRTSRFFY